MNTLLEQYNAALTRINNDELDGVLSEEDANFHRENLMAEFEEAQFAEQQDEQVAEFTAGNSLGALLLEVGQNAGYEDAESYIYDLSAELGITPDEVVDLITTEEEPDDELTYAVASELGLIEDEGEDYEEEDEVEEEYEDEGEEESSYSQYPQESMFSDPRVDQLESQIAEFQVQNALKDTLHKLDLRGQELVNNGDMPPMAYNILFSSFDTEDDRIAAFSQVAEANGNTLTEELTAIEKTLEIFSRMGLGELGLFSQLIEDESVGEFSQEDAAILLEAELNAKHFLTRNK